MTSALLLDILLTLIVLLSVPLGFWRGVTREVVVSAAILLGATIAAAWSERWGNELGGWLLVSPTSARLIVAAGLMVTATLIVGYGGGSLVARGAPIGLWGRFSGAALAAANATVLLGWALGNIEQYLADGRAMEVMQDAFLSRVLLRDLDWVLVGLGAVWMVLVLLGLVIAIVIGSPAALPAPAGDLPPQRAGAGAHHDRLRPVRMPREADSGKFEPESRRFDPMTGRFAADAPSVGSTAPIGAVDPTRWSIDRSSSGPDSSWQSRRPDQTEPPPQHRRFAGNEWLRRSGSDDRAPRSSGVSSEPGARGESDQIRVGQQEKSTGQHHPAWGAAAGRCGVCGLTANKGDSFCPRCGGPVLP